MKKSLKIWLIVWWSLLVVWWAWFYLTKSLLIQNKLNIKLYDWRDDQCYSTCKNWCIDDTIPGWMDCCGKCTKVCKVPKYENCISKCNKPSIEWFDKKNYDNRYEKNRNSQIQDKRSNPNVSYKSNTYLDNYFWDYDYIFMKKEWYDKRISENFSWHLKELEEYKSCILTCWDAPSYILYHKPIIYLYPTTETEINVKLWTPENLSHTYPKYNWEKWRNVIGQPNGNLKDIDTWRKLYALYREWKSETPTNFDEWFVVKWKDIIPFLEEKLAILWLNEREAEEFIVYWLPQLEDNEWNLIRFETMKEQDENMPLNITPKPDTVIRVMMDWKVIDEPIDIPEQELVTPERNGFTVVERWWSPRN